jgi:hypothetical protein
MPELTLRTGQDTYVLEADPTKRNAQSRFLKIRSGDELIPLFYMPVNATRIAGKTITSAVLSIAVENNWVDQTVTIQALDADWKVARVDYNTKPGVTGPTANSGATGALSAGDRFEIDVTDLIQEIADGQANYGWRLTTSQSTTASWIRGFDSGYDSFVMTVEFIDRPDAPTQLAPEGVIGVGNPVVTVDDYDDLAEIQVQVDATPSGTDPDYDSGWVATTKPKVDLATLVANALPSSQGNAGTFDTDINGWLGANATLARVTTPTQSGAGALRLTASSAADMYGTPSNLTADMVPVVPGQTVHVEAYSRAATTTRSTRVEIQWYDSGGVSLSVSTGTATANSNAAWGLREMSAEAPANAAYMRPRGYVISPALGEQHYWDSFKVNTGTTDYELTNGSTTYWRARVKLLDGGISEWSSWAEITRDNKPSIVDDTGTTIYDPSPIFEAHLSPAGDADTRWQVIISEVGDPANVRYNSGPDIEGATLAHEVPLKNAKGIKVFPDDGTYRREIRAWDRSDRVPSQGDKAYVSLVDTITLNADGALDAPTLTVAMVEDDNGYPRPRLHIEALAEPEWFVVRRDGEFLTRFDAPDFEVALLEWEWDDEGAAPNVEHSYRVRSGTTVSGERRDSPGSNEVTITATVESVWLRSDFGNVELFGDGIEAAQVDKRQTFDRPYHSESMDIVTAIGMIEGTAALTLDRRATDLDESRSIIESLRNAPDAEVQLVWGTHSIWVNLRGLSCTMSPASIMPANPIYDVRFGFFEINPVD